MWQKEHRFRRPPRRGASPSPSQPHPSCVTQALSEAISSPRLTTSRAALAGTEGSLGHRHRPGGRSRRTPRDEAVRVQRCSGHSLPPPDTQAFPDTHPGQQCPHSPPVSPFSLPTTHFSVSTELSKQIGASPWSTKKFSGLRHKAESRGFSPGARVAGRGLRRPARFQLAALGKG